jgi:hypothetical protein
MLALLTAATSTAAPVPKEKPDPLLDASKLGPARRDDFSDFLVASGCPSEDTSPN